MALVCSSSQIHVACFELYREKVPYKIERFWFWRVKNPPYHSQILRYGETRKALFTPYAGQGTMGVIREPERLDREDRSSSALQSIDKGMLP